MSFRLLPGSERMPSDRICIRDHAEILAQAQSAVARRKEAYPQLVANGSMLSEDAARDIASWELIAAEWQWIITGDGSPPPPASHANRIEAVDLALERVETTLRRRPRDAALLEQRDLILAMRWHLSCLRYGAPEIHFWAECTHEMRRSAAAPERRAAA